MHLGSVLKQIERHVYAKRSHVSENNVGVNPLTTDDAFWRRQTLAACYQLAQPVLKIGFALAERMGQGEVGGCTPLGIAWWLLQLAVEKLWSVLGRPFVCFLAQTGIENAPFAL